MNQKNQDQIAHIERYEQHPIVRGVLAQDATFREEVEDFYGLTSSIRRTVTPEPMAVYPSVEYREKFHLMNEDPQKTGKHPESLVEILNGFVEEPFDVSRLQYEDVREDYKRWHAPSRTARAYAIAIPTFFGSIAASSGAILYGMNGNIENAAVLGAAAIGSFGTHIWCLRNQPDPKGTNNEFHEYMRLHRNAKKADSFMQDSYRPHFIRKNLDKE